jgi:hypothetical protein
MQGRRTRPATAGNFYQLADVAHERGLRLFRDGTRWYCSSANRPGEAHYVTGLSCDCPGFIAHQRCTHHALLLERLGRLPELEDAAPVLPTVGKTPADCPDCSGCGVVDYRTFEERCPSCTGSGIRPNHHLHDAPATPMVARAARLFHFGTNIGAVAWPPLPFTQQETAMSNQCTESTTTLE